MFRPGTTSLTLGGDAKTGGRSIRNDLTFNIFWMKFSKNWVGGRPPCPTGPECFNKHMLLPNILF